MDIEFDKSHSDKMPVFNQKVLDGIAFWQLQDPKRWIDACIRTAEQSFPEEVEFVGSKVCSPMEAYRVMADLKSRIDKSIVVDMASSDVFMVKYQFRAKGVDLITRYMLLPDFKKGNEIRIAGKVFTSMSVLTDPGFSVTSDYVFLRVTRAPMTFERAIHSVIKDGETLNSYMAHAKLHWRGGANDRTRESDSIRVGGVVSTLAHYLFCKHGVEETFKRYASTAVLVVHNKDVTDEMREENHVYTTRGVAPRALKLKVDYALYASPLAILVPKSAMSPLVEDLIVSMWYILDHFPDLDDPQELFSDYQWKVWLGYVLWGDQLGHPKLVENIESHLKSLDDYVDNQTQQELLEEEGVKIDDLYHLFAFVIGNMNEMINNREGSVASMYNKRLKSVQYVLKDIVEKIFKCMFDLNSTRRRKYEIGDYNQSFGRYFTISTIMGLRSTSTKPFMSIVSTPGDNMYYRGTSRLVMQSKTGERNPGASSAVNVNDPANHVHASWMEGGNYAVLPGSFPLGKATLNPTVKLDELYTITPKPELKEIIKYVDGVLDR